MVSKSVTNKTVLKNGVKIVTKKMPYAHSISMGIWANVGARDESSIEENGLSHFVEHMIFKGTRSRTGLQIAKEFDAIGGQTNAFTTMENTCWHARVMNEHFETMVDILCDIYLNSLFDSKEVEKERPVILQEIGMVEDSPDEYVHVLAESNFWGNNPLGRSILGTQSNIVNFEAETIKEFFHHFFQPDRLIVAIVGNIEHERIVDCIAPAFESIKNGNAFPERNTPEKCFTINLHNKKLEQAHICLSAKGLSVTDPHRYAFSLLNVMLGGNMSSRLFQEIRERKGLAYSIYSFISPYADTGIFGVYAGVEPKNAAKTTKLILQEINKLKKAKISSEELRRAKEYIKGNVLIASESVDNQMVKLAQNEINWNHHIHLQEVINKIERVKEEDIFELTEDLFKMDKIALTIMGCVKNKKIYEDMFNDEQSHY